MLMECHRFLMGSGPVRVIVLAFCVSGLSIRDCTSVFLKVYLLKSTRYLDYRPIIYTYIYELLTQG